MKKNILYIILIGLIATTAIGLYMWNKPHRSAKNEKPSYSLQAAELLKSYSENETESNAKYLDKTIEVIGTIEDLKAVEDPTEKGKELIEIVLATDDPLETINCQLIKGENIASLEIGMTISIKGICTGYLSMSGVNLHQCAVVESK